MNFNVLLAVLQRKGIITEAEAIAVAEYVANSPQSTYYLDAYHAIETLIGEPVKNPILPGIDMSAKDEKPADSDDKVKKATDKKSK